MKFRVSIIDRLPKHRQHFVRFLHCLEDLFVIVFYRQCKEQAGLVVV